MLAIIQKWLWKTIDYDKVYNMQCVDWSRQFALEQGNPIWTFSWSALANEVAEVTDEEIIGYIRKYYELLWEECKPKKYFLNI